MKREREVSRDDKKKRGVKRWKEKERCQEMIRERFWDKRKRDVKRWMIRERAMSRDEW